MSNSINSTPIIYAPNAAVIMNDVSETDTQIACDQNSVATELNSQSIKEANEGYKARKRKIKDEFGSALAKNIVEFASGVVHVAGGVTTGYMATRTSSKESLDSDGNLTGIKLEPKYRDQHIDAWNQGSNGTANLVNSSGGIAGAVLDQDAGQAGLEADQQQAASERLRDAASQRRNEVSTWEQRSQSAADRSTSATDVFFQGSQSAARA